MGHRAAPLGNVEAADLASIGRQRGQQTNANGKSGAHSHSKSFAQDSPALQSDDLGLMLAGRLDARCLASLASRVLFSGFVSAKFGPEITVCLESRPRR
jgi:hypothetical protein